MEPTLAFSFKETSDITTPITHEELMAIAELDTTDETIFQLKQEGKGVCHVYKQIIETSATKNEEYSLRVWSLNQPQLLQSASIFELLIRKDDHIVFHKVQVLRNKNQIDKLSDFTVRVFNDEKASAQGSIDNTRKVHGVINDLRLGDILVLEYSKISTFTDTSYIDKKYYRHTHDLPAGFWFYKTYQVTFLQKRPEALCLRKRYFRTASGERIPDEDVVLHEGQQFDFIETDYQKEHDEMVFNPFFEIATQASWKAINEYLYTFYKDILTNDDLQNISLETLVHVEDGDSQNEKIRKIIEYVQNNIVYLYDGDTMHGHVSEPAAKTLEMKAGDCKAKSMLLIKLLAKIDVPAQFILVNYSFDHYIADNQPSPFVFNHAVVKIVVDGADYFIDPTWSNRVGELHQRTQPYFSAYLPIDGVSDLQHRDYTPSPVLTIEETTTITIKKSVATLESFTIFRRDAADNFRTISRNNDKNQVLAHLNESVASMLGYTKEKDLKQIFKDAEYEIFLEDKAKNEMTLRYKTTLTEPYIVENKQSIFKYYYPLDAAYIVNNHHKDAVFGSFISHHARYELTVTSDLFYKRSNPITKRNLKIDNAYFSFFNKKKLKWKTIQVISEFTPKTYGVIKPEDFEILRKDIKQIADSNFGVGIVYVSMQRFWIIAIIIALWIIFRVFMHL